MVKPFILTLLRNLLSGIVRLGLDDLIFNAKSLPLLALSVFLPRECRSFNTLKRRVRYLWRCFLSVYIRGCINRVFLYLYDNTLIQAPNIIIRRFCIPLITSHS